MYVLNLFVMRHICFKDWGWAGLHELQFADHHESQKIRLCACKLVIFVCVHYRFRLDVGCAYRLRMGWGLNAGQGSK